MIAYLGAITKRLLIIAAICCALAAPSSAAAAITAYVDQDTSQLVIEGTSANEDIYISGDADSDEILLNSGGAITTGWGCYEDIHQVYCGRGPYPWQFSIYANLGAGDDRILRDYQSAGSPDYDPALLDGGPGDDIVGGSGGDDVLVGGTGDDMVDGHRGDDLVIGGPLELAPGETPGTDHVYGGWGDDLADDGDDDSVAVDADRLDGGSCVPAIEGYPYCRDDGPNPDDFDVVDWSLRSHAVRVDLRETGPTQGALGPGGVVTENETLVNLDGAYTGDGEDLLTGTAADEFLDGGVGADVVDGGGGMDAAGYVERSEAVAVNLASAAAIQGAAGEGDLFVGIESVVGGDGPDHLTGSSAQNAIDGGPGNDVIRSDGDPGSVDGVWCDDGSDSLTRDPDDVQEDCETVDVPGIVTGPPPPAPKPPVVVVPDEPLLPKPPGISGSKAASARIGSGGTLRLRGHRVSCPGIGPRCHLTATLRGRGQIGKLSTRRLTLGAGHRWTIKLKLGKTARKLLQRRHTVRARLDLTVTRGGISLHRRLAVTLRAH